LVLEILVGTDGCYLEIRSVSKELNYFTLHGKLPVSCHHSPRSVYLPSLEMLSAFTLGTSKVHEYRGRMVLLRLAGEVPCCCCSEEEDPLLAPPVVALLGSSC